jgi:hypothetical protein
MSISIAVILVVMIYRETIERWFRRMQAAQRLKSRQDRLRSRKREGD